MMAEGEEGAALDGIMISFDVDDQPFGREGVPEIDLSFGLHKDLLSKDGENTTNDKAELEVERVINGNLDGVNKVEDTQNGPNVDLEAPDPFVDFTHADLNGGLVATPPGKEAIVISNLTESYLVTNKLEEVGTLEKDSVSTSLEVLGSATLDDIEFDFDNEPSQVTEDVNLLEEANAKPPGAENVMGDQVPQDTDLKNPDVQSPSKEERGESSLQTEAADATQTTGVSENLDTAESHAKSDSDDEFDFEVVPVKSKFTDPQKLPKESSSNTGTLSNHDDEFDFEVPTAGPKVTEAEPSAGDVPVAVQSPPSLEPESRVRSEFRERESNIEKRPQEADDSQITVPPVSEPALMEAEDAWSKVETVTPTVCDGEAQDAAVKRVAPKPLVSHQEFLDHCQSSHWQVHLPNVKTSVDRHGFACIKQFLFGPPKMRPDLTNERDMIFCLAASPLNNEESLHFRVLQTVHRKLTGSKFDCARFGSHWEDIGFQGNDPATDLRSAGILGLLQLLHLVTDPKTSALASDIYRLSTHEVQNFPFCIMGINMTRIALLTLREGALNKVCNRQSEVLSPLNELYAASYYRLYHIWKSQHKTIADSGYVMKDVEELAKKNPRNLIESLRTHLDSRKSKSTAKEEVFTESAGSANFMDVCADE